MKFDIISIIYIAICLVFIIVGFKKGFLKSLISVLKNIVSVIVASIFAGPIAKIILATSIGTSLNDKIKDFLSSLPAFSKIVEIKDGVVSSEGMLTLEKAVSNLSLPESIQSFLVDIVNKINSFGSGTDQAGLAETVAPAISYLILSVISFGILFLICRILVLIFNKFADALTKIPLIGTVDRILGLTLSLLEVLIIICGVSYIFTVIVPFDNALSNWLSNTMCLNSSEITISKYFFEHNFLSSILTWLLKIIA